MKLSDQVISLDAARVLEGYGIQQKGAAFYHHNGGSWQILADGYFNPDDEECDYYAAFTVAELGSMLPQTISFNGTQKASIDYGWMNAFHIAYRRHSSLRYCTKIIENVHEVGARVDMLIHLLESGLTTPDEINSRLATSQLTHQGSWGDKK